MIDYNKYLKNRVIIISGVGRSGTTILGKIIGSMENTFYFFEPAIMKYLPRPIRGFSDDYDYYRYLKHFRIFCIDYVNKSNSLRLQIEALQGELYFQILDFL